MTTPIANVTVETIGTLERLDALAPQWWALWEQSATATPFQTPAMLLAYWRSFSPGTLACIAVFQGKALIGLVPLYLETSDAGQRLLLLGMGPCDLLDCLVDARNAANACTALADALAEQPHRCDFEYLREGSSALSLSVPTGWSVKEAQQSVVQTTQIDPTIDIEAVVPPHQRRKWRMAQHRAERRGGYAFRHADETTLDADLGNLFRLHRQRWERVGEEGVFHSAAMQGFITEAARGLFVRDLLILTTLTIADEAAGVFLGFRDKAAHYAFASGFDPAFAYESPGTLLIGHALTEAKVAGAREFNWLRGDETYKTHWGAVPGSLFRRSLIPPATPAVTRSQWEIAS